MIDGDSDQEQSGPTPGAAPPRIDLGKLARLFVVLLVLPMTLAWVMDGMLGSTPIVTIAAIVIFIPAAAIVIIGQALQEMDRVIEVVAPADKAEADDADDGHGEEPGQAAARE